MQQLVKHCHQFKGANTKHGLFQLITTAGGYFALCAIMLYSFLNESYVVAALLMLPAAGFLVRLFIIQHDCGHNSFFHSPQANNWTGRFISILTFTPYDYWRRSHAMHHAASGNLNKRGLGSIDTLTVKEYEALPRGQRITYRIYRSPFVQLVICPLLYIFVVQRFPPSQTLPFLKEYYSMPLAMSWRSIMSLNLAIVVCFGLFGVLLGWKALFLCYLPVVVLTSWIGGWLFFIQHQFEDTYWKNGEHWDFRDAAVMGSSYYVLPPILQWFTGNIGIHHVHHLCPMIPNYKLQSCLDASPTLQATNRMTFLQSLKCIRWALWDEDRKRMVAFADI